MKFPSIFTGTTDPAIKTLRHRVLILLVCLASLVLAASGAGRYLDRLAYDNAVTRPDPSALPADILIVALDEISFDVVADETDGLLWPYPRAFHARVISNLARAGAKAVFMDLVLDLPSGFGSDDDRALAEALGRIPVVLAGEFGAGSMIGPLPVFLDAGALQANVSVPVDTDHRVRCMRNADGLPGDFWQALGYFSGNILSFRDVVREPPPEAPPVQEVLFSLLNPGRPVPEPGFIYYHGPADSFPVLSYFEVLNDDLFEFRKDGVRDKIVFIGRTITASITPEQQPDVFPVPYAGRMMAGVEILANAYAGMAGGRTRTLVPPAAMLLLILGWFFMTVRVLDRLKHPLTGLVFFLVSLAAVRAGHALAYAHHLVLTISPLVFFSAAFFLVTLGRQYVRERDRRLLTQAQLFNYLPRRVAEFVLNNPQKLAMAGDRTRITILFADLAGFTGLSEKYPPEIIIPLLQDHLRDMTRIIFHHQGTLDKYLGDGIMAFWGAPEAQDNHADLALKAALDMLQALDQANVKRREAGLEALSLRIGLHTGEAVVGNIGSELFIDYTAIGDNVNTASRIEGAGKFFSTRITVSRECVEALTSAPPARLFRLGRVGLKGRNLPVSLYTVADPDLAEAHRELEDFLDILDREGPEKAVLKLESILERFPGFGPARFHEEKFQSDSFPRQDDRHQPYWRLDGK